MSSPDKKSVFRVTPPSVEQGEGNEIRMSFSEAEAWAIVIIDGFLSRENQQDFIEYSHMAWSSFISWCERSEHTEEDDVSFDLLISRAKSLYEMVHFFALAGMASELIQGAVISRLSTRENKQDSDAEALALATLCTTFDIDVVELFTAAVNNSFPSREGTLTSAEFGSLISIISFVSIFADGEDFEKLLPTLQHILKYDMDRSQSGVDTISAKEKADLSNALRYKIALIKDENPDLAEKIYAALGEASLGSLYTDVAIYGQDEIFYGVTGNGLFTIVENLDLARKNEAATVEIIKHADHSSEEVLTTCARIIIDAFPNSSSIKSEFLKKILIKGNSEQFTQKKYELIKDCSTVDGDPIKIDERTAQKLIENGYFWQVAIGINTYDKADLATVQQSEIQIVIAYLFASLDDDQIVQICAGKCVKYLARHMYAIIHAFETLRPKVAKRLLEEDEELRSKYEAARKEYDRTGDGVLSLEMLPVQEVIAKDTITLTGGKENEQLDAVCHFFVLEEGTLVQKEVSFTRVTSSEVLDPFLYKKPDIYDFGTGKGVLHPAEIEEDEKNQRKDYIPLGFVSNAYRGPNHWHRADEGLFCAVFQEGEWQTRYFPKQNIPEKTWSQAERILGTESEE